MTAWLSIPQCIVKVHVSCHNRHCYPPSRVCMCVWLVSVHVYAQGDTKAGHWVSSSIAVSLIYLGHSTRSSTFLVCCAATELTPHMSTAPALLLPPLAGVIGAGLCSSPMLVSMVLGIPPACPAMFWPTQPSPQSPNLTSTGFLKQLRSYTELLMTSFWVDAFPLSGSQRMWATLMQSAVIPSCHCLLFWTIVPNGFVLCWKWRIV